MNTYTFYWESKGGNRYQSGDEVIKAESWGEAEMLLRKTIECKYGIDFISIYSSTEKLGLKEKIFDTYDIKESDSRKTKMEKIVYGTIATLMLIALGIYLLLTAGSGGNTGMEQFY